MSNKLVVVLPMLSRTHSPTSHKAGQPLATLRKQACMDCHTSKTMY